MLLRSTVAYASTYMPAQGTEIAREVDSLYTFLNVASLISFAILIGGMAFFVFKYKRQSEKDLTPYISHNTFLEFLWSFIPFVIFIVVAVWGIFIYEDMRNMPEDGLEVRVFAKKWEWSFSYRNGKMVTNTLGDDGEISYATMVVPVNKPVKLIMASEEKAARAVLHSFFVPAFRIKQDVVPGRYTALHFTATKLGNFNIFCTEYCGTGHSKMLGKIRVVTEEEFNAWLSADEDAGEMTLAERGKVVYQQNQCIGCHSVNGSRIVGPTFKGVFGSQRELADGSKVKVDENYIRSSILNPNGQVVKGYPANIMPVYKGVLTDAQITQLIEFIKSVE